MTEERYVDPDRETFAAFRAMERDGPLHMLNLVQLLDKAIYDDGRQISGVDAYAAYGRQSGPVFHRVGGRILWRGQFEFILIGPSDECWDHCFIAEYPNLAAFVEMVRDPAYRQAVKHRQAAVLTSRLIRTRPKEGGDFFG